MSSARSHDSQHYVDPLTKSVVEQGEKWSPYRNLLVFSSTVLLWHRPVFFVILALATHLVLWYTTVAIIKWNLWLVVGIVLALGFTADYLCGLFDITWDKCLSYFPLNGSEKYSYEEIIQQYVSTRRYIAEKRDMALAFRQEQPQQFLITSLFFTLVLCFCLSLVNIFTIVYWSVFLCLLAPGLLHNEIPKRISVHAFPLMKSLYDVTHDNLTSLIHPTEQNDSPDNDNTAPERKPQSQQSVYPTKPAAAPYNTRSNAAPPSAFYTSPPPYARNSTATQTIPSSNYLVRPSMQEPRRRYQ